MKETDMLNAWLWEKHREDLQWRRVRLGPIPSKAMARMYMTMLRYVDAIVIKEGIVYIIEAKLRPNFGVIGQLEGYNLLFYNSPEFTQYKLYPSQMIILSAIVSLDVAELASKKDIAFEVFSEEDVNKTRMAQMLPVV